TRPGRLVVLHPARWPGRPSLMERVMSSATTPAGSGGEPASEPPTCTRCGIPTKHVDSGPWDAGVYWCPKCRTVYKTEPDLKGYRPGLVPTPPPAVPPVAIWWTSAPYREAPAPQVQSLPRLVFDLRTNTVTLDGTSYTGLDPEALRVLKAIAEAAPKK